MSARGVPGVAALAALLAAGTLAGSDAWSLELGHPSLASVLLCHFAHVSLDQVLWAGVPALLFALGCSRDLGTARLLVLSAGVALATSAAVLLLDRDLSSYRGASGLGHGLAAACALGAPRRTALLLLGLLGAKVGVELATGHLLWDAGLAAAGARPVPLAHAAGLVSGAVISNGLRVPTVVDATNGRP